MVMVKRGWSEDATLRDTGAEGPRGINPDLTLSFNPDFT